MTIPGTPYSPAKAFNTFARDFIRALSKGDVGTALSGLDVSEDGTRWSKSTLESALAQVVSGRVTTPDGHRRSSKPRCSEIEADELYEVEHRLPINGKWSDVVASFRFRRRRGEYWSVSFCGFRSDGAKPPHPRSP